MYTVIATAPTGYQSSSLKHFNLPIKKHGDGSFSASETFATEQEAKEFLKQRAEIYYDEYEGQVDDHIEGIEKFGSLTIDAATARIVEND